MVDHEIVYVLVLALLNLVDLNLHAKGQLALQALHLRIILLNQRLFVRLELLLQDLQVLLMLVCLSLDLADVCLVVPLIILLLVCLAISIVLLRHLMVGVLFSHNFSAFHLHVCDVLLVLILVVLHLLQVGDHKSIVRLLLALHLRVEVLDLGLELLDLFARVHIEIVDHVLLNLQGIALHFRITKLLAEVLNRDLQLLTTHGHKLILRLGLLLLLLAPLSLLSFSAHWYVFFLLKFKK